MKRVALYAAATGFVVFAGFPFYWMLVTSFKQNQDLYVGASDLSHIPWIFNDPPTLAFQRGILGADLGQGAAIAVFLLPFLIVVAIGMLRLAHRTEVGGTR